ncbi:F-box domain, cyclin-like protein [Tanacetum coccineum]
MKRSRSLKPDTASLSTLGSELPNRLLHQNLQPIQLTSLNSFSIAASSAHSINDNGLRLIAFRCPNLTLLKLSGCGKITDKGTIVKSLEMIAVSDKSLVDVHLEYFDETKGLIAVGKHSANLQELSLIGVNASCVSLEVIATNCKKLVRIVLSRSETISDVEMSCIAEKCVALKFLCIAGVVVSKRGSLVVKLEPPVIRAYRGCFTGNNRCGVTGRERVSTSSTSSRNVYLIVATINLGPAAKSLKVIKLRHVYNEWLFEPLIIGWKNLKRLKLINCDGNWDRSLEMIRDDSCLAEVHLEDVNVSDVGVSSLAKCHDLISLCIENSRCTDV